MGTETRGPEVSPPALICTGVFFGYLIIRKLQIGLSEMSFGWRTIVWIGISAVLSTTALLCLPRIEALLRRRAQEKKILANGVDAVYCGETVDQEAVFIKTSQRAMHTQIIGTTNAGKTESVILPWAIQDIEQGRGLILIDGKADRSLLNKLWAYTKHYGRESDFKLFSLSTTDESHTFNPLIGGTAEEVSERVFNSFEFENEYYRSIQFEAFSQTMRIFADRNEVPTFKKLHEALSYPRLLVNMAKSSSDGSLKAWAEQFKELPSQERAQRVSGLLAAMSHFAFGKTSPLYNAETPSFTIDEALSKNLIVYFQLPVLLSPFLGRASGKLALQCAQSAVANRHRTGGEKPKFYSIFLDDFSEYLTPSFVSVLNKSRSANVGVAFAHQALGDINTLGDAIANSILTNANLKIFMRGNDPDSAEYFSRVIGTEKTIKYTERTKLSVFAKSGTGDASAREVDEFTIHPNRFKRELGVGEAMMIVPHERGSKTVHVKFRKYDDLPEIPLPKIEKPSPNGLLTQGQKASLKEAFVA